MGTLHLVRHGQASFFDANYDRLSTLGESQARLLGACWARRGVQLSRVFTGPRVRQQRTAELAGEAFAQAGGSWPTPLLIEEMDEMRIEPLFRQHLPEISAKHPNLRTLGDALLAADGDEARARIFERLFEGVVALWMKGQLTAEGVEAWSDFRNRVRRSVGLVCGGPNEGLDRAARGEHVAVFTSAGPVAAALQLSLGLEDEKAMDLAWRVRNSSDTQFLFSGERLSLLAFNELPHLEDAELVTLR
jgi:broad specificity phosphatase PhoE